MLQDQKIVQWLHLLILDTMSVSILTSYLDALQTLKSKVSKMFLIFMHKLQEVHGIAV